MIFDLIQRSLGYLDFHKDDDGAKKRDTLKKKKV